jgi:hypothetical protein
MLRARAVQVKYLAQSLRADLQTSRSARARDPGNFTYA